MLYTFLFLIGLALGAALLQSRNYWVARELRRIPKTWPLKTRSLVNNREKRVWLWLMRVMFDQQVLVKLPITRFTTPSKLHEASHWYKLLNGVYCTFTLCNIDGRVIGCIDVPGPAGLSMGNQTLKHTLLSQCGIRYWVVDPEALPSLTKIRTAFLGESAMKGHRADHLEDQIKDMSESLHAAVTRQRLNKASQHARLDIDVTETRGFTDSHLQSGWEQNSFLTPLDSRSAPLGS
jgi:hypothetical protein